MNKWKTLLEEELKEHNETFDDIIQNTMSEEEMEKEFRDSCGMPEGIAFTVWTSNRVYFPYQTELAEWVGSVSRNPNNIPTRHIGAY